MTSRRLLVLITVLASLTALASPAGAATSKHRLKAFGSCSRFVHYARRHALGELTTRGVPVGPVFTPPTRNPQSQTALPESAPTAGGDAGTDYSTTNVQEAGVDEPDIVKTDGKRIFSISNGRLFAVDARGDTPKLLGSLALDGYGQDMLLSGDRALVFSSTPVYYPVEIGSPGVRAAIAPVPYYGQTSTLSLVDVSDPSAMKVLKTMSVNGNYLTARLTGHTARVVFSATPQALPVLQTSAVDVRSEKIARTTTPSWRPSYTLRRGRKGKIARHALVRCTSIQRPEIFSGLDSLTVLTIDIDKGLDPVDSDAVMTDAQTVYASQKNLYVATAKAMVEQPNSAEQPPPVQTAIHKFDISDPQQTHYEATGTVSGTLLNQYSMSEQDGFLRVATTEAPLWWSPGDNKPSESFVTVLKQDGSVLTQAGRVGELGKGERIYSVRFIGDLGYVVTFRQVDPLYVVGLSDPEQPKVLGSLDLLGYSAYLHPVGDGLLLGVGQAANEQGQRDGTQVSLFDVSDPKSPKRLANAVVGNGSSDVEYDPHAFLWWAPSKLAVLPVQVYTYDESKGTSSSFAGAIGFHATRPDGVKETGRISHPADQYGNAAAIQRSIVIGDRIFTMSFAGIMASDLTSFAEKGFAAFPVEAPTAGSGTGTGTAEPGRPTASPPPAG